MIRKITPKNITLPWLISGDDISITETGCLTNAGLYEADLRKLMDRADGMTIETDNHPQKTRGFV